MHALVGADLSYKQYSGPTSNSKNLILSAGTKFDKYNKAGKFQKKKTDDC